jgi:cysteine desulfurase NifS/selenium donor protein
MMPYLNEIFGNPSSSHAEGVKAKMAVEKARGQIATLINCDPEEVIFTSGGSESNNYALKGVAYANRHKGRHIITSSIEHPAVTEVCDFLEKEGFEITYLRVDDQGLVAPETLREAIRPDTILVSVMHANNEVGTIQPVAELAAIAHENGALFHTDAAQSLGKIPADVQALGVDLLSIAGHKLYAPKGIGALYIRTGVKLEKLIHGADHERNLRAGTENVLEIVGLGEAAGIAAKELDEHASHYQEMRDLLEAQLKEKIPGIKVNAGQAPRLPNTSSVSFPGVEANTLLDSLEGVAASAGAACHTDKIDVSAVLEAMRIPVHFAMGTIRFTTGRNNTRQEILKAADLVADAVKQLQGDQESEFQPVAISHEEVKLTHFTHGLGCACKLRPQDLEKVLQNIPVLNDPKVLVGTDTSDDATVYQINDEQALVQTLDFFTPIVDEPYYFGAIAAANALSDIYAMGARPLFALNIVGFPDKRLPMSVLEEILSGARDKAEEAGIAILGGHTVEDTEPKYGMVVTGLIHPDKVKKNQGAKPGDHLVLTKPIGTGIISTATKRGLTTAATREKAIRIMSTLNNHAAEIMGNFNVHACTDVTGFGLMGHLREMILKTKVGVEMKLSKVPFIEEAVAFARAGILPGGTLNNHAYVAPQMMWDPAMTQTEQYLLCDAQTSGGLLMAVAADEVELLLKEMHEKGIEAADIATFNDTNPSVIKVEKS